MRFDIIRLIMHHRSRHHRPSAGQKAITTLSDQAVMAGGVGWLPRALAGGGREAIRAAQASVRRRSNGRLVLVPLWLPAEGDPSMRAHAPSAQAHPADEAEGEARQRNLCETGKTKERQKARLKMRD